MTDKMVGSSWIGFTQYKKHHRFYFLETLAFFFFGLVLRFQNFVRSGFKKNNRIFFTTNYNKHDIFSTNQAQNPSQSGRGLHALSRA